MPDIVQETLLIHSLFTTPFKEDLPPHIRKLRHREKIVNGRVKIWAQIWSSFFFLSFFRNCSWRGSSIKSCSVSLELEGLVLVCSYQFVFTLRLLTWESYILIMKWCAQHSFTRTMYSYTHSRSLMTPGEEFYIFKLNLGHNKFHSR